MLERYPAPRTAQVEWYLSSSRLAADRFLSEQARDHDGWIPIATLLSFPRMRKLCHPQARRRTPPSRDWRARER